CAQPGGGETLRRHRGTQQIAIVEQVALVPREAFGVAVLHGRERIALAESRGERARKLRALMRVAAFDAKQDQAADGAVAQLVEQHLLAFGGGLRHERGQVRDETRLRDDEDRGCDKGGPDKECDVAAFHSGRSSVMVMTERSPSACLNSIVLMWAPSPLMRISLMILRIASSRGVSSRRHWVMVPSASS